MISFDSIKQRFPDRSAAFPSDWPKPNAEELAKIEGDFGVRYSEQFREFQLRECHSTPIGDVAFDYFGWAHPSLGPMENLRMIVEEAQGSGVPRDLAPFRCDNGDFSVRPVTGEWLSGITMLARSSRTHDISGARLPIG
jgi:hypothetical protein